MRRHPPWRSGCGLPCGVRQRPGGRWPVQPRGGALRGEPEHPAAHGGQVHGEGIIPAVHAAVGGVEVQLAAALVGTAPLGSLGVQHQLRRAGELEVQRELFVGVVLGVHDAQQVLAPALAQPGVDALGAALAGHPLKAVGVVFAVKQGGLGGVYQAQAGEILLESVMEGILEQVPVQLPFSSHSRKCPSSLPMKLSFLPGCIYI